LLARHDLSLMPTTAMVFAVRTISSMMAGSFPKAKPLHEKCAVPYIASASRQALTAEIAVS
jgi:hypothetical protein